MDLDIRKAVINNLNNASHDDIETTIKNALELSEEKTLPGLGVLFAPKKGSETRQELKVKLDDMISKLKEVDIDEVKTEIENKMLELMGKRKDKQPLEYPSAGSTFKRKNEYSCYRSWPYRRLFREGFPAGGAQGAESQRCIAG